MSEKERVAKWDNLKAYLIALVVIGHVLQYFTDYSDLAKGLYLFIYSFHMPAFIFVAGLFSKHAIYEKRLSSIIEFLLIYVIMDFLDAIGKTLSGGTENLHFLWESGPAWFALAMAVFLAAAMFLDRFDKRYVMMIALFLGCIAGLDSHFGDHFASMRICVFLPVFLAGWCIDVHMIQDFAEGAKGIVLKLAGIAVLLLVLLMCIAQTERFYPFLKLFKGKYEYAEMDMGIEGVLIRLACYVFWAIMISAIIFATNRRNNIYTWLGSRTMAIFIWHSIAITIVFKVFHMVKWLTVNTPDMYLIEAVCIAIVITIITAYLPEFRVSRKLDRR